MTKPTTRTKSSKAIARPAPATPRQAVNVQSAPGATSEERRTDIQHALLAPETRAAVALCAVAQRTGGGQVDIPDAMAILRKQAAAVQSGDLSQVEAMLMNQANTLEAIFTNLATKAANAEYIPTMEALLKLGLRAQNQCRATLETLATIKAPPVIFAKQANISQGHQQVNNGKAHAHAPENHFQQNELLEAKPYEPMDTRAPRQASGINSSMATMETINRG